MPRPSKRVSPDTLGGRIRAARQELHLTLAEVAGDRYSTSLISQIERNRVDPSQESLRYLADRLELPLEDLVAWAQQQRNSEVEVSRYKVYEEQRDRWKTAWSNWTYAAERSPSSSDGAISSFSPAASAAATGLRMHSR